MLHLPFGMVAVLFAVVDSVGYLVICSSLVLPEIELFAQFRIDFIIFIGHVDTPQITYRFDYFIHHID